MTAVPDAETALEASPEPRVAVVIASAGRRQLLQQVVADLRRRTLPDLTVVVSVPRADSLPRTSLPGGVVVTHARGLTAQRNAGMAALPGVTHFFYDDAVVRTDYVQQATAFFPDHPDVVALTGRVLLDGAASRTARSVSRDEALRVLRDCEGNGLPGTWRPSREFYGCNFGVSARAAPDERFDERSPLYGWLEDHDFARPMMRHGRLARVDDCVVVHRGVTSGDRAGHERLGYSQVMNPTYLLRTGSCRLWLAVHEIWRRIAKNLVRSVGNRDRAWRRERLQDNVQTMLNVLRGRLQPERALDIAAPH